MANLMSSVTTVVEMMISLTTTLLTNEFFCFLMACGVVKIGLSLVRKTKRTAKA